MDDMWYDIGCEELCGHIAIYVGSTMYSCNMKDASIDGTSFFGMVDHDWKLFFETIGVKSFHHMRLMKKWVSQRNEQGKIVNEVPLLAPIKIQHAPKLRPIGAIMAKLKSAVTHSFEDDDECFMLEECEARSGPHQKVASPCDSLLERLEKARAVKLIGRSFCTRTPRVRLVHIRIPTVKLVILAPFFLVIPIVFVFVRIVEVSTHTSPQASCFSSPESIYFTLGRK